MPADGVGASKFAPKAANAVEAGVVGEADGATPAPALCGADAVGATRMLDPSSADPAVVVDAAGGGEAAGRRTAAVAGAGGLRRSVK